MTERFVWLEGEVVLPQCLQCKHLIGNGKCSAFPNGIPAAIIEGRHDHRQPYRGDNGIHFEPIEAAKSSAVGLQEFADTCPECGREAWPDPMDDLEGGIRWACRFCGHVVEDTSG